MSLQADLAWTLSPPRQKLGSWGWGAGRELVGGKIHDSIWVMKQEIPKEMGGGAEQSGVLWFQIFHHIKSR